MAGRLRTGKSTPRACQKFPLVNNTDSLYPTVHWFAYPKVGQRNPSCRVGAGQLRIRRDDMDRVAG